MKTGNANVTLDSTNKIQHMMLHNDGLLVEIQEKIIISHSANPSQQIFTLLENTSFLSTYPVTTN